MTASTGNRLRLHYLDGLRGLAALYVVFSHLWELQGNDLPEIWLTATKVFRYGLFSVAIFIVLSGYCLMLPVVRNQSGHLSGSLRDFFQRRARRILPTYFAALLISIMIGVIISFLFNQHLFPWDEKLFGHFTRTFSLTDLLTHLLLIHNLTPGKEIFQINGPMWSVATEWQIYFIFPFILLPIWRRSNFIVTTIVAFGLGLIPHYLFNNAIELAHPWFIGLFALGMGAAEIGFSARQSLVYLRKKTPWGILSLIFFGLALFTEWQTLRLPMWVNESFAGFASACLLIYCTNCITAINKPKRPLVLRIFESPFAVFIGSFSYSLYLVHVVIMTPFNQYLRSLPISTTQGSIILYLISLPACLLFAYFFYLVCERPFLSNFAHKSHKKDSLN